MGYQAVAAHIDQLFSSAALQRVLKLLESLNSSNSGSTLYRHIERSFQDLESAQFECERQYIDLLELLLEALSRQLGSDSPLQTNLKILRASLTPAMHSRERQQLRDEMQRLIASLPPPRELGPMEQSIDTLLAHSASAAPQPQSGLHATPVREEPAAAPATPRRGAEVLQESPPLQQTRTALQGIKARLDEQLGEAERHSSEFSRLIKDSMEAIRLVDGKQDIDAMRLAHLRRYISLFKEHQELTTRFSLIHQQLSEIDTESQQLDEQLNHVHKLSMTDELTQLPNRRALLQRLNDEVARVQRYGVPLALAIIDLDDFKPINDTFGHSAGDAVLRHFAETALSVCRLHDTVARYGGEEFALLLPNTELEGALCALRKIQANTGGTLCRIEDGVEITVPTFSAGVALYNPGEAPEELIKRADTAMYRAKHSGRNRIEVHTMGMKQGQARR